MKNLFNSVKYPNVGSNVFDLTHDVKLSTIMGRLTPVMVMDVIPGDKISIGTETLIRFQPLIAPVMHRMDVTIHYFFVPNRILWDGWEEFITTGEYQSTPPTPPFFVAGPGTGAIGTLANYMGIPQPAVNTPSINILPFSAYQCIYNEYYRDENLCPEIDYKVIDGDNSAQPNLADLAALRIRAWQHDYFTACLPFAQKGTAVEIPIGTQPDLLVKLDLNTVAVGTTTWQGTTTVPDDTAITAQHGTSTVSPFGQLYAEGGVQLGNTTINDLRTAYRLQEWLEKNARGGTRYVESMLVHFGVRSSDARLQRPEYITGSKSPVIVSEVLNTTGETGGLPQGTQAGHAISVTNGHQGSFYCEEHGWIIGIMSVMPKPAYQQGLHRMWQRFYPTDYAWPTFANLGEQAVTNNEIFIDHTNPQDTFGYIPRYSEYKYMPNRVAGDLQDTLDFWHFGRIFDTLNEPDLNQEFIECVPRTDPFAVTTGDYLICHVLNKVKAVRKLPVYGTPTF